MTATATEQDTATLTRIEAAYAHLAAFKAGDRVDVAGPGFHLPGTVTTPQRDDGGNLEDAWLIVTSGAVRTIIWVSDLLTGSRTVTTWDDTNNGRIRYFDEAGYAAQNG